MSNYTEPDGCSRDIDICYGDLPPNGHFYAENVRVFYPLDPDKPNLVSCPVYERGRCGVRVLNMQELSREEIDALPPCRQLAVRFSLDPAFRNLLATTETIPSKRTRDDRYDAGSPYHW